MSSNHWYKDAVFYELNLRAFADGNGDGHGDFIGLIERMDYLVELGVTAVWLMPFYPSPLKDNGYDISDFYNIDPAYGTLDDFKRALAEFHKRGIRVTVDLVVNHTSDQHPWFIESRSSKDNPKRDWYVWSDTDQKYQDTRIIFVDTEPSNWTLDPLTGEYFWHRFYKEQPDLNYDNPEVQAEMLNIMRFWLKMGIDGFRVDAVPYLFEREGQNGENLPETHAYIKQMRAMMDKEFPGTIMLAEANQWPKDLMPYLQGDEFHMGFHFPLMPRLFMAVRQHNRRELINILNETPMLPEDLQWCIFLRNHDELTLEMVTEEQRQWMWKEYAPDPRMKLNLGIRRRLAPLLDNDRRRIDLLNALLFSLPGTPILYYGDEIGMGDDIWRYDRNGVRTPLQWDTSKHAGFSTADKIVEDVITDDVYGYHRVNVAAARQDAGSLFNAIRHQISVRKQHQIFGQGDFQILYPANEAIFAFERFQEKPELGASRVLVVANLADSEQEVVLDTSTYGNVTPVDLLTGQAYPKLGSSTYTLRLPAYGCIWLGV
ncbi:MAG: maltose alpha-D-glucosyltransferase [Chloroflexi bacterium]|nr:maltose alpha-D-glucosyltransferase [Chloroflexota bacterium]NOG66295.1 maltose alpha-D-glucosyltransferase [Chloroflexota bacterium]